MPQIHPGALESLAGPEKTHVRRFCGPAIGACRTGSAGRLWARWGVGKGYGWGEAVAGLGGAVAGLGGELRATGKKRGGGATQN